MVETSITSRTLTYRDPTVTAAAEAQQLRRNRQRGLDTLENQAQRTANAAAETAQFEQSKADSYRAAQDAADGNDPNRSPSVQGNQPGLNRTATDSTPDDANRPATAQAGNDAAGTDGQSHAPFTTQVIAQEYIGEGLHVPPLQPADEAYRRAGAEPPLIDESRSAGLVSMAI